MHHVPRRLIRGAAVGTALALTIALASCSADMTEAGGASETLTIVSAGDAAPNQVFGQSQWFTPVLEPLVRKDAETGQPDAVLAESWELSDDFSQISFTLTSGVTFHDGRPLTAADVVFSLEQAQNPENNSKALAVASRVASIEADGDDRVVVTFTGPTSNLWDLFYMTPVVDPDTYDGIADGSVVNGTGPFTWESWTTGTELRLAKYDDYRAADNVYYSAIDVLVITDASAQQSALRSGRAQMAFDLTTQDAKSLETVGFRTEEGRVMSVGMGMNVTAYPFDNPLAREAVGYAVDRQRLIDQANGGVGDVTDLWWGSTTPGWSEELAGQYSYDPEKAKQLVQEAGVEGAAVPLIFPTSPLYLSYYDIIADGLEAAGFAPEAQQLELNEAVSRLQRGDLGPSYLYYDATTDLAPATTLSSVNIFTTGDDSPQKYSDPAYDSLLAAVQNAATEEEQATATAAMTEFLLDVSFNQAFVTVPTVTAVSDDVDTTSSDSAVYTTRGNLTGLGIRPAE